MTLSLRLYASCSGLPVHRGLWFMELCLGTGLEMAGFAMEIWGEPAHELLTALRT